MRVKGTRDIAKLRAEAKDAIDAAYNQAMNHPELMSPGTGIAVTYLKCEAEAIEYLTSGGNHAPGTYRWLEKLVGVTGEDLNQVAQIVAYMADFWQNIGPELNAIRLTQKDAVDAATTPAAIDAARNAAVDEFNQILAQLL